MSDELYLALGKNVQHYRRAAKMTQAELARELGLTRPSIANIEVGRQRILLHHVFVLANALRVSVDDLCPGFNPIARDIIRIPFKRFPEVEAA